MAYVPQAQETEWQMCNAIDLSKAAVIVIDELGGNQQVASHLETMVANSVKIVQAARCTGVPVIFANDSHIPAYDRELALWGNHGLVGTQDSIPFDAFMLCESDIQIPKRRYDAFFQTDLDLTLRELDVDTLIVIGWDTNICVMQTLAGAFYRCYKTIVAADATTTFLIGDQNQALEYFTKCFDTRVVDTATVLEYLS